MTQTWKCLLLNCSALYLLSELLLDHTQGSVFEERWTILCHSSWVRAEQPHQPAFTNLLWLFRSDRPRPKSSVPQRRRIICVPTRPECCRGRNSTARNSSRVKISVTFPSGTCPSDKLSNNMEGNQVWQRHNFLFTDVKKHNWHLCVSLFQAWFVKYD